MFKYDPMMYSGSTIWTIGWFIVWTVIGNAGERWRLYIANGQVLEASHKNSKKTKAYFQIYILFLLGFLLYATDVRRFD